ncbi:hypothetical protein SAMN04487764_2688 [Gillisia sp. Hel1_33_143]|nr:hypothetical protein SAMN04487764_2688 [Gillisia sp. Hel1_33_143]
MQKPEKYIWKKSYTWMLVTNMTYIIMFYVIMKSFS